MELPFGSAGVLILNTQIDVRRLKILLIL